MDNMNWQQSKLLDIVAKVSKEELREDQYTKEQCLGQFRDWIKHNPDIVNCITDDSFLLRFLRAKKYSLQMAQQTLLKYLNLRKTFPLIFNNLDYTESRVYEIINNGYIFASPFRDAHGRRVTITLGRNFDPQRYSSIDMARAHVITYEMLLDDEITQILGVTHFGDAAECGASFVTMWSVNEFIQLIRWGQQSYPMRHKQFHVMNIHPIVKYVYDFIYSLASEKLRKRTFIYDNTKDVLKNVDPQVLPKEYGGVMPIAEMVELWKQELAKKRDRLLSYDRMKLLSDRGIITRRNKLTGCSLEDGSVIGSFRKLEVD